MGCSFVQLCGRYKRIMIFVTVIFQNKFLYRIYLRLGAKMELFLAEWREVAASLKDMMIGE